MKELNESESKPMVEMSVGIEQQQEKQKKLLGHIRPGDGHLIWKMNVSTLIVELIDDSDLITDISWDETPRKRILTQQGFLYCSALNKKNAIKRFGKMLNHIYGNNIISSKEDSEAQEDTK